MKRYLWIVIGVLNVCSSALASYHGCVFVDKNRNGLCDKGEKKVAGVVISDGLNVVKTDAQGNFLLKGHPRQRFIFVTTPSGYKIPTGHFHPITTDSISYDFALIPYEAGIDKQGNHKFVHISDTEIHNTVGNEQWVENIRDYAANERVSFIVHTGDICYAAGMKKHITLMNTNNMQVPVYYCIGNHDLVSGKYGEEMFENIYGPVYYSFESGNVHYIVTPMPGGDYRPGYTRQDVYAWLKNDLAHVKKGTPIIIFNHDILTHSDRFIYKGNTENSICLNDYNLKAWIYGHWHINHIKKQGDVYTICTSSLDKGGIDHSSNAFRVMHIDGQGNPRSELRYAYLDKKITIAAFCGSQLLVNTYSSVSPVKKVSVEGLLEGKQVFNKVLLEQCTDWTWKATLPIKKIWKNKELKLKISAYFNNGEIAEIENSYVVSKELPEVQLTENWDNMLATPAHTATNQAYVDNLLQLVWAKNLKANLCMTSPLIHDGKVFIASMDENFRKEAYLYALNGKDGSLIWKTPLAHSVKNSITITDGKVFAQDVLGNLYAVDIDTGLLVWKVKLPVNELPSLIEGLVSCDKIVYAGTGKALSAINASTGEVIWRNKGWNQREGTTTTLSMGNGVLIGSVQWGALHANDAITGKYLWSLSEHGLRNRGASAAIHGSLLYIVSGKSFFIIEAQTGRIVVRKELPYNMDATSTPLLTDKEIILGTADKGLVALDNQTLEEKWRTPVGAALVYSVPYTRPDVQTIETSPVCVGEIVYVAASDGCIYGVSKKEGRIVWKYQSGAPFLSSVAVSGNSLVASDLGGNIYLFSTMTEKSKRKNK